MVVVRRMCIAAAVWTALQLVVRDIRAEPSGDASTEPSGDATSAEDERFAHFLEVIAADHQRGRMRSAGFDATAAALTVPLSVVLMTRSDPGAVAVGAALVPQSVYDLFGVWWNLSQPGPMELLHSHYVARRAAGQSPSEARARTESEWRNECAASRHDATLLAVLDVALGGAELAAGTYFVLGNPGVLGDRTEQTAWGAVLLGVGLSSFLGGLGSFGGTSSLAGWWAIYQSAAPSISRPVGPRIVLLPSLALVPLAHGAAGVASVAF